MASSLTGAAFQAEGRISRGSVLSPGNSTLDPSPGAIVSDVDDAFSQNKTTLAMAEAVLT